MSELALVAFAAAGDAHAAPNDARTGRFVAFAAAFDEAACRLDLEQRNLRWLARSDPAFPPLLASIHDPPPGLFLRGAASLPALPQPNAPAPN